MLRELLTRRHAADLVPSNPRRHEGPCPCEAMSDGLSECLSTPCLLVLGSLCAGKTSTGRRLALGGTRRARHVVVLQAGRPFDEEIWVPWPPTA